ncbi:unnamed protein product, partial [Mesorhabditis spiculigera]
MPSRKRQHSPIRRKGRPEKLAKIDVPLLQLPANIFNNIVRFLDAPSLVQLAKSHALLEKMVRGAEKHWSEVYLASGSSSLMCIDYDCFDDPADTELLFSNAKVDKFTRDEPVRDARQFIDLPTVLMREILKSLDDWTTLEVEKVHDRLAACCKKSPIDVVRDWQRASDDDGIFETAWAVQGDGGWVEVRDKDSLIGKHVHSFKFWGDGSYWGGWFRFRPTFTSHNFYYLLPWCSERPINATHLIEYKRMYETLKPENAYTSYVMDCKEVFRSLNGSLAVDYAENKKQMAIVKGWHVPRLGIGIVDNEGIVSQFLLDYIDEWLAGEREIEALWVRPGWSVPLEGPEAHKEGYYELAEMPNVIQKYALTIDAKGIVRGQLKREKDGKMLALRARETHIILQAPGAEMFFLNGISGGGHFVAPDF